MRGEAMPVSATPGHPKPCRHERLSAELPGGAPPAAQEASRHSTSIRTFCRSTLDGAARLSGKTHVSRPERAVPASRGESGDTPQTASAMGQPTHRLATEEKA